MASEPGDPATAPVPAVTPATAFAAPIPCKSCGSPIAPTAKICPNCKSSQQLWREELKYWGGLTSLATAIASGATFTGALLVTAYQIFFSPALTPTEIDSQGQSVVWSTQKIWVDTFNVKSALPFFDLGWQIHQAITKPEEPAKFDLARMAGCQWQGSDGALFDDAGVDIYTPNLPPADVAAKIHQPQIDQHFVPVVLLKDGAEYQQLAKVPSLGLTEIPLSCSFSYTRLDTGHKGEQSVSCVGVLKNHDPAVAQNTAGCGATP